MQRKGDGRAGGRGPERERDLVAFAMVGHAPDAFALKRKFLKEKAAGPEGLGFRSELPPGGGKGSKAVPAREAGGEGRASPRRPRRLVVPTAPVCSLDVWHGHEGGVYGRVSVFLYSSLECVCVFRHRFC